MEKVDACRETPPGGAEARAADQGAAGTAGRQREASPAESGKGREDYRTSKRWRQRRRRWIVLDAVCGPLAPAYRALLRRALFIGVTGSTGKTTTKELISAALSSRLSGTANRGNLNISVARAIFRARPWHQFYVQEIAAAIEGQKVPLEEPLGLLRPRIGVVTNIGTDHLSAFGSKEAIAAHKGKLIEALPETGTAVLNADDPLVLAMRSRCRGRIVTYGLEPQAMVRAENIRGDWPDRLSFDVVHDGERHAVRTQLCGAHWTPCVLAALATAVAAGVPLGAAARGVEAVSPVQGRMQPVVRPDGVTFIRDDAKAPLWSIAPTFDFLRSARAERKIVVIGTISDYKAKSATAYTRVAEQALDIADLVIFVGPRSHKCLKAKRHPKGAALQAFLSKDAASDYLGEVLKPGDLVLLKGSGFADRLATLCSAGIGSERRHATTADAPQPGPAGRPVRIIAGLGNPGEEFEGTPHNVGHQVVDRLAQSLGGRWERRGDALVATVAWKGTTLHLVKSMTLMNRTGPALLNVCRELGAGPADCLLVHDDIDLPVGADRVRAGGGDGGHRGVRSVLQAFETIAIPRVKIGVGRPRQEKGAADHVLRPFAPEELAAIEAACAKAAERVLELVASPGK